MISRTPGVTPPSIPGPRDGAVERRNPAAAPDDPSTAAPSPAAGARGGDAPPGVDPALWSVLTTEEKAFFARRSGLGPLTYGRRTSAPDGQGGPIPPGGRIDIRV